MLLSPLDCLCLFIQGLAAVACRCVVIALCAISSATGLTSALVRALPGPACSQ